MITLQDFCYEDLFKDLNLFIVKNKITVISGANNCGKTLLIRILNREIVTSNIVFINNREMNKYKIEEFSKLVHCIIPLEITTKTNSKAKSLAVFMKKFTVPNAYRITENNFSTKKDIRYIPVYAVFCLNDTK